MATGDKRITGDKRTTGDKDEKGFVLDEDKITRKEFERTMSSREDPKYERSTTATKDGEDDIPKGQTKIVRGNADDAELDDEETVKIFDSRDEKAEKDARDYAEFLNWKAGEKRLRDEERRIKFGTMLKEKERKDKAQAILKDEERKIHIRALKEMERRGKFEDAQALKRHLKFEEPDKDEIEQEEENVQVQYEELNGDDTDDIFCSPEKKD